MKHLKYAKYLIMHYIFVVFFGLKFGLKPQQIILHDWSKLRPSEWFPYANFQYGEKTGVSKVAFDFAVSLHYKRNKHHPEHYVVTGEDFVCEMPEQYFKEMMADWFGTNPDHTVESVTEWYLNTGWKKPMNEKTRSMVHDFLDLDNSQRGLVWEKLDN